MTQATTAPLARHMRTSRLDGVRVRWRPGHTRQVITVNKTGATYARVTFWWRKPGHWIKRWRTRNARIGYGGMVAPHRRRQGTGTTPTGTYTITESFGNSHKPAHTHVPFHRVRRGDYWVEDNASRYYNQLRNKSQGGFRWRLPPGNVNSSERLRAYPVQYRWALVINFNRPHPVRHRGAGIFLHINGSGATAGCVSVPVWYLRRTMRHMRPRWDPRIAIGR
ncbi:MAG: L,D-transpeptidase family protein [Nocardioidaceae bacterium]